ncbi:MAG: DUF3298 domain-containing protein [Bacteroidales bacterium]|nr:DUF3298 domain-containing protein [Bacteroidales bacterium]
MNTYRFTAAAALLLSITVGLHSCVKPSGTQSRIEADSIAFVRGCTDTTGASPCLRITMLFPVLAGGVSEQFCAEVLGDYLDFIEADGARCSSIDGFKQSLLSYAYGVDSSYAQYPSTMEVIPEWFVTVWFEVLRNDDQLITLKYYYNDYRGGAHGAYYYHYQNLDAKTLRPLALTDLVNDVDGLARIAERRLMEVAQQMDLRYPDDFTFDDGKFVLPKEIGFCNGELVLHYNIYEVAPYALGAIEVPIAYADIASMLSRKL